MAKTTLYRVICCGLLCVSVLSGSVGAGPKPPKYPERQVYNPVTGTWSVAPSPVAGTEQGDLQPAMIDLTENRPKQAKDRLKKWIKKYPNSEQKGDAMVALGDAEPALDNRMQAYREYEKALDKYPGLEGEERIVRHEFAIGVAFLSGEKQKVFGIFRFPAFEEGLDILEKVVQRAPGWCWRRMRSRRRRITITARGILHWRRRNMLGWRRSFRVGDIRGWRC